MNVTIIWAATGHHNVCANLNGLNNDVLSSAESAVSTIYHNDSSLCFDASTRSTSQVASVDCISNSYNSRQLGPRTGSHCMHPAPGDVVDPGEFHRRPTGD